MQNHFALIIAKDHMVKPHISPQWNQGTVWFLPGPGAGIKGRFRKRSLRVLFDPHQGDFTRIRLRLGFHDFKYPLRTGNGGKNGIDLL